MAYPIHPIAKSLTHVARFKCGGVNIEQFIREVFSRQNDLSGSFFLIYREGFFQVLAFLLTIVVAVQNGPDFFSL